MANTDEDVRTGKSTQSKNLEPGETQPPRNDLKEQRGGRQEDQITGQTEKGARTANGGRAN